MVETLKVVNFQEFKQVHTQQFEPYAQMSSEYNVIIEVYHIHDIVRIVLPQKLKNLKLDSRLIIILLLIFNEFNGNILASFMVSTFQSRAKRTFAQK